MPCGLNAHMNISSNLCFVLIFLFKGAYWHFKCVKYHKSNKVLQHSLGLHYECNKIGQNNNAICKFGAKNLPMRIFQSNHRSLIHFTHKIQKQNKYAFNLNIVLSLKTTYHYIPNKMFLNFLGLQTLINSIHIFM